MLNSHFPPHYIHICVLENAYKQSAAVFWSLSVYFGIAGIQIL